MASPAANRPSLRGGCGVVLRALALAAVLVAGLVPAAAAFDSIPNGPHDRVTADAAHAAAYPSKGVLSLQQAVRGPDIRDNKLDPKATKVTNFEVTGEYRPYHHCDRVPPAGGEESFLRTVDYARQQGEGARTALAASNATGAVHLLGNALHAIEDCFSHSNAVDLADPAVVVRAVNGEGGFPQDLHLTGFLPGAQDNEHPPGDDYPHGDFAKDSANKNTESSTRMADDRTKFEHARDLATQAATLYLQHWMEDVTPAEAQQLANVPPAKEGGGLPSIHVPASGAIVALGGLWLAAAAVTARRR